MVLDLLSFFSTVMSLLELFLMVDIIVSFAKGFGGGAAKAVETTGGGFGQGMENIGKGWESATNGVKAMADSIKKAKEPSAMRKAELNNIARLEAHQASATRLVALMDQKMSVRLKAIIEFLRKLKDEFPKLTTNNEKGKLKAAIVNVLNATKDVLREEKVKRNTILGAYDLTIKEEIEIQKLVKIRDDAKSELSKGTYNASTTPTKEKVEALIDQIDEYESKIGKLLPNVQKGELVLRRLIASGRIEEKFLEDGITHLNNIPSEFKDAVAIDSIIGIIEKVLEEVEQDKDLISILSGNEDEVKELLRELSGHENKIGPLLKEYGEEKKKELVDTTKKAKTSARSMRPMPLNVANPNYKDCVIKFNSKGVSIMFETIGGIGRGKHTIQIDLNKSRRLEDVEAEIIKRCGNPVLEAIKKNNRIYNMTINRCS